MGSHIRPLLFAAPLMLAAPVHAQQTDTSTGGFQLPQTGSTPAPDPNRQGPELNVYRDPVTPRATPPVVAPTVTPPPATVQPTPTQSSRPRPVPATTPATPRAETRPSRPAERPTPTPPPAQTRPAPAVPAPAPAEPAPTETDETTVNSSAPAAPPAPLLPAPAANAIDSPETAPTDTTAPVAEDGISLPWTIAAIVAALVVLAGLIMLRRRRPAAAHDEAPAPTRTPAPVAKPKAAVPPPPAPEPADTLHVPAPVPTAAPAAATERPWIDMDMAVGQARYSLMGVTISYALILHNRGDRPAQDVLVRGMIGNGGAQQQAVLQGFFTGQDGLPLHSAVAIQPGETIQLNGELRLSTDEIVPVEMGQRSLLIPLAAFDAGYRWDAEAGDPVGQGRTARAFIVGQEQEPPAARLAPLRLDQGPRQYRRPAARAAAELTPA